VTDHPVPTFGLLYFATDVSVPLDDFARAAEDRGFHTLHLPEHTNMPISAVDKYPTGEPLPERYKRSFDPYIGLTYVAARTNLRLATCISLIAQHDPVILAKEIATLDHLSGGRFTLGVGFGWNEAELENHHGRIFGQRRRFARESVELMRALWTEEVAAYEGELLSMTPAWSWPKPHLGRAVPVLLGVAPTPKGFAQIVEWGDGWIPGGGSPAMLGGWLAELRSRWEDAGRGPTPPTVWVLQPVVDDAGLRAQVDAFRDLGIDEVILDLQAVGRDDVMATLDRYARVLAEDLAAGARA
jgi:probable F420-dependent oxidoreductase